MIPLAATFIVYGLKMAWAGKVDFNSIPYVQTAFAMGWGALWGYLRADRDWAEEEKRCAEAGTSPNSADRADG
jgi:hypothetical protein